jgi:hypothetical protein
LSVKVLEILTGIDYDYEHRFAEHEHDTQDTPEPAIGIEEMKTSVL